MIPTEIVVTVILLYLVLKIAKWWAAARTLQEKNAALTKENDELRATAVTLSDQLAAATRPAQSTKPNNG